MDDAGAWLGFLLAEVWVSLPEAVRRDLGQRYPGGVKFHTGPLSAYQGWAAGVAGCDWIWIAPEPRSDRATRATIAHEIAHIHLHHTDGCPAFELVAAEDYQASHDTDVQKEIEAWRCACDWGYSPEWLQGGD